VGDQVEVVDVALVVGRRRGREARGDDARRLQCRGNRSAPECPDSGGVRIANRRRCQPDGEARSDVVAGIHPLQPKQAVGQERGGHEQRDGQRELRRHQDAPYGAGPARASGSAAFRAQRHEPPAEDGRDRREAHQEPARHAERHGNGDRAGIQHDLVRPRQVRRDRVHQPETQRGDPDGGERRQRREHQPFREHQTGDPEPGRAEGGADRELVTARRDPHQQEGGDVGERAYQDQQHRAGEEPELLGGAAHDGVAERIGGEPGDAVPEAGAPERIEALADPGEIAGRAVEGDLRFQPSDAAEPERPAPGGRCGLEHRPRRGPHAGQLVQLGRQHADDRVAHAVE
jgi:hypothetical protein